MVMVFNLISEVQLYFETIHQQKNDSETLHAASSLSDSMTSTAQSTIGSSSSPQDESSASTSNYSSEQKQQASLTTTSTAADICEKKLPVTNLSGYAVPPITYDNCHDTDIEFKVSLDEHVSIRNMRWRLLKCPTKVLNRVFATSTLIEEDVRQTAVCCFCFVF